MANPTYNITTINTPITATDFYFNGVNSAGVAVGYYYDNGVHSFIESNGAYTLLNAPGATNNTYALGINDAGVVVGFYSDNTGIHSFVESNGTYTPLNAPGATATYASGINNAGVVVGYVIAGGGVTHGFVETNGAYTILDAPGATSTYAQGINSAGTVFGYYFDSANHSHGFVETNGAYTIIDAPGATSTYAYGINSAGAVVGTYYDSSGAHGFVESKGVYTILDAPGATSTYASRINDAGAVVGSFYNGVGTQGFVESNGTYTILNAPGATSTYTSGINSAGEVIGTYYDSNGIHGFSATTAAPQVVAEKASVTVGGSIAGTAGTGGTGALAGDSDPNGATLSIIAIQGGQLGASVAGQYGHLTLNADGSYAYVADHAGSLAANTAAVHDVFTFTVNNGYGGTATSTLDVSVDPLHVVTEQASVTAGNSVSGTAGAGGTGALAGDVNPSGATLSVTAVQGGQLGTAVAGQYGHLTLNADGSYAYVADNTGKLEVNTAAAHDVFTFTVDNGFGSTATSTLDVAVTPEHVNNIYRFYDTVTYDHFYTSSANEAANLKGSLPSFTYEGSPWATPDASANTHDVFRFFDTVTKTHFLTDNATEAANIRATLPSFNDEGVAFQSYDKVGNASEYALERFYNTDSHVHTYAANPAEIAFIKSGGAGQGWVDEGASFIVHTPAHA